MLFLPCLLILVLRPGFFFLFRLTQPPQEPFFYQSPFFPDPLFLPTFLSQESDFFLLFVNQGFDFPFFVSFSRCRYFSRFQAFVFCSRPLICPLFVGFFETTHVLFFLTLTFLPSFLFFQRYQPRTFLHFVPSIFCGSPSVNDPPPFKLLFLLSHLSFSDRVFLLLTCSDRFPFLFLLFIGFDNPLVVLGPPGFPCIFSGELYSLSHRELVLFFRLPPMSPTSVTQTTDIYKRNRSVGDTTKKKHRPHPNLFTRLLEPLQVGTHPFHFSLARNPSCSP